MSKNRRERRATPLEHLPNKSSSAPAPKNANADRNDAEFRKLQLENDRMELENDITRIELKQLRREERHAAASAFNHCEFTFDQGVNKGSVRRCMTVVGNMTRGRRRCKIKIILNSPGGYVSSGMSLFGYLRDLRRRGHHITIVVFGRAASMGGILLQVADWRVMDAYAWLLIHEISAGDYGKTTQRQEDLDFVKRQEHQLLSILAKRAKQGITIEVITEHWRKKDWWLSAHEAKEHGFCDEVLEDD